MLVTQKRGLALLLLAVAVAFGIVSLVSNAWVDHRGMENAPTGGVYGIGLREWTLHDNPLAGDSPDFSFDTPGSGPWLWNPTLLGPQNEWKQAGLAAFALGIIGVVCAGLALLATLLSLALLEMSKLPSAVLSLVSGLSFFLGAVIYEGMRPSFWGDVGYGWPLGLYLGGGVGAALASVLTYSADYLPLTKNKMRQGATI